MKKTMRIILSCLLCAALLLPMGLSALAENGPFEESWEDWYPAFLYLTVLDDKEEPVTVMNEYGFEENTNLPLWTNNKATPQEGAVYDRATNTLTLTDFNKGNYALAANMMGDDFTVCVKGDCRLSYVTVWGDGWGGSLRITGDGTLTVNPNSTFDYGISLIPEGAVPSFTVDPTASVTVRGKETAISVRFTDQPATVTVGGNAVTMDKETVVREEYLYLTGYSNPWEENLRLCRNAADPDGIYDMSVMYKDDAMTVVNEVTVDRFVYIEQYDLYLKDYQWAEETGGSHKASFATEQEANDAGFTLLYDDEGDDRWMTVNTMGNHGTAYRVYQDPDGNRYIKDYGYDDQRVMRDIALTIHPLDEISGEYLFLYTPDVDPETLTEVKEMVVHEGEYDYTYPGKELKYTAQSAPAFLIGDVDQNGKVESADARLALRASVKLESYADGSNSFLAADVDHNGKIESSDARSILRASVNLEKLA